MSLSRQVFLGLIAVALTTACETATTTEPSAAFLQARTRASTAPREWRSYLGDNAVSHRSPLTEIDKANVDRLEVAWTYDAGGLPEGGGTQIQTTPLIVKGVLYGVSPSLRLFAIDASTGEELWSFEPDDEGPSFAQTRGLTYWADGDDERIFFGAGPLLNAVDAKTGRLVPGFAEDGVLDLRDGLGREVRSDDMMGVVLSTPAAAFEDLLLVGGRVNEAAGAAPGHVRAFDARTGEMRWIFHTIPQPGEPGHETWPKDAWKTFGGANAWAGISIDEERGLAFVPTGSAAPDFFGGDRAGDNLFANSLIALDARTGERRWHYQFVRHDLWDRDLPSPPNLVEVERNGRRIAAVAQTTKTGHTFVFDRETGEPLVPIEEVPVGPDAIEGEAPAKTQPLSMAPPPFVRQGFTIDDIEGRTAELHAAALQRAQPLRIGGPFEPPSPEGTVLMPGTDGGAEWGGSAWDGESGLLFVNGNQIASIVQMLEIEPDQAMSPGIAYVYLCASCHGLDMKGDGGSIPSLVGVGDRLGPIQLYDIIMQGRGRMPGFGSLLEWWQAGALAGWLYLADADDAPSTWASQATNETTFVNAGYQDFLDADGVPVTKPPWGTLTAIDLNAQNIRWQVPLGDYPVVLESGRKGLGAQNYGGPVLTASGLLFIAATPDAKMRAFDSASGRVLWETDLPAPGFATPATYEADGRQFVVIAAGGGKLQTPSGSMYVAFSLPRAADVATAQDDRT